MAKTSSGTDLKHKVWQYIKKILIKPQKKIGGLSICPFLKQYLDNVSVVETEDWELKISQVSELLHAVGYEAVVICGPDEDYDILMDIVDDYNSRYYNRDIEILLMHPDTDDFPLPLEYNFHYSPLVIVQKHSTLQDARNILQKAGKYYNYYK
jgi:hypothetical protein